MTDSATFTATEAGEEELGELLLEVLPGDGSTIGNPSAREALSRKAERPISEEGGIQFENNMGCPGMDWKEKASISS